MIILLLLMLVVSNYIIYVSHNLSADYLFNEFLIIIVMWGISVLLTYKHKPRYYQKEIKYVISPYFHSIFIYIICISLYAVWGKCHSVILVAKCLCLYSFIEIIVVYLIFKNKSIHNEEDTNNMMQYNQIEYDLNLCDIFVIDDNKLMDSDYIEEQKKCGNVDSLQIFRKDIKRLNAILCSMHNRLRKGGYLLIEVLFSDNIITEIELQGRLSYCGFDYIKKFGENNSCILARKTKDISNNPNPSKSILIKLNRVSLYGKIIKIHKIRTMYPYSEFLQKKIYEQNSIGNTGKFANDPRITKWGAFFRKYWIDELPQLLDWMRGEIKLVGIRAMSQHYFSLYNKEYQDLYKKVKPGIISPIFDENTDSFEDIQRIEYEYLRKYVEHPFLTDCRYLYLTLKSIALGVRSK